MSTPRGIRITTLIVALAVALACSSTLQAGAQSTNEKPKATETGVTPTEIHIAVAADVDNSFAPGAFQGAVNGVEGAAAYLNSTAGGSGIGGRTLVVDFYDSKLNADAARNATIQACDNDLALVGGGMLLLSSVNDITNCKDLAGQTTGLPDIPSLVSSAEMCAPLTYPAIGYQGVCSPTTHQIVSWLAYSGEGKWLLSQHKNNLHGPMIVSSDTKDSTRGGTAIALGFQKAGVKADQGTVVPMSAIVPQSAFTGVIQRMKADKSNFALMASAASLALSLRNEATLQGLNSSQVVWQCSSCYGNDVVKKNPESFEGEYESLSFLPFDEASSNKTLAAFTKYVGKLGSPDQFSAYSFEATLAFAQAARAAVAKHGQNGLTRSSLIEALRSLTDFDAGGMAGSHSFKSNTLTNCFVEVQFENGKWSRAYPAKKGTFDCKPSNLVPIPSSAVG